MDIPSYKLKEASESQKEMETSSNVYETVKDEPSHACPCGCVSRLSALVPQVYREEMVHIVKLAGPVVSPFGHFDRWLCNNSQAKS